MYSFTFDSETGGVVLGSERTVDKREARPVWSAEMDYLGFDKYFTYDKQDTLPYLWAIKTQYYYRGIAIARITGGNYFESPELHVERLLYPAIGTELEPVDIDGMLDKNATQLGALEEFSRDKLREAYDQYKDKVDIFKVAFSGGKDSEALFSVVRQALPNGSYVVIFGDTGMEFPDTYDVINQVKRQCEQVGIPFYVAQSRLDALETWDSFCPPSRFERWCHMVHKVAPSVIKIRELVGKRQFQEFDIVGARRYESLKRNSYQYLHLSNQVEGQYTFYPILEWSSAEVWLEVFKSGMPINACYKKGLARAGCVCCPMSRNRNHLRAYCYPQEFNVFMNVVKKYYGEQDEKFYNSTAWGGRRPGYASQDLTNLCVCVCKDGVFTADVIKEETDWREWIKTIGELKETPRGYSVTFNGNEYEFTVEDKPDGGYTVKTITKVKNRGFTKRFRSVFRKAAYCLGCQTCEVNCTRGNLTFDENGKPHINGDCSGCSACHEYICLRSTALFVPKR